MVLSCVTGTDAPQARDVRWWVLARSMAGIALAVLVAGGTSFLTTGMTMGGPTPARAPQQAAADATGKAAGKKALRWARKQVGKPYRYGAAGPNSFDCSGLTMRAWEHAGVHLPHQSERQYRQTDRVSLDALRKGDLVFFSSNSRASGIHHVGIYAGGGKMVHAPGSGEHVEVAGIHRGNLFRAGRP